MKVYLLVPLLLSASLATCQEYTFDSGFEDWLSYRDHWRWGDRSTENVTFPGTNDGFLLMSEHQKSDELYLENVTLPNGGSVTVTIFGRSPFRKSTNLYLQKAYLHPTQAQTIADFDQYFTPFSNEWQTVTVNLEPDLRTYILSFFCYNSEEAEPGDYFQGCAIDCITITDEGGSELTTQAQTRETQDGETTAENYETPTTNQNGGASEDPNEPTTQHNIRTTFEQTKSTSEEYKPPTTTTKGETSQNPDEHTTESSNKETPTISSEKTHHSTTTPTITTKTTTMKTTTSHHNGLTTEELNSPTTEFAKQLYHYNFENDTQGWTLQHMNGASWKRVQDTTTNQSNYVLQVFKEEMHTGTTVAQSPILIGRQTTVFMYLRAYLTGSRKFPSQLLVRKRSSFPNFDVETIYAVNSFNDKNPDTGYMIGAVDVQLGEKFSLSFEGNIGGNDENLVIIKEFLVEGVEEAESPSSVHFDFESDLTGWSTGNMDGGKWLLMNWGTEKESLKVPRPASGTGFLSIFSFDINAGSISIESSKIERVSSFVVVTFKYWMRGTSDNPAILRFRYKTPDGEYQDVPFATVLKARDSKQSDWLDYSFTFEPLLRSQYDNYYQLVIEGNLGGGVFNVIAVDDIRVIPIHLH